jgi:hypothetical protein
VWQSGCFGRLSSDVCALNALLKMSALAKQVSLTVLDRVNTAKLEAQ